MKLKNKVILATFFVVGIAVSMFLTTPNVYAATAKSQDDLKSVANSITVKNDNTLEGKLGSQTITFSKKTREDPSNMNPALRKTYYFEATNLDCKGDKVTISKHPIEAQYALNGKYLDGDSCKGGDSLIIVSVTVDSSGKPTKSATSGDGTEGADSCKALDSGPLGWILCPVIDLAGTFSHGVFNQFIKPFLEDTPVTTDPNDGVYQAWKQFRLIGNIVLVGTMIAVVYAQVRGGKN